MAQLRNKEALEAAIVRCFQTNTDASKLHVTPDGQCFLENNKSFAELHARRNQWSVKTVERADYAIPAFEKLAKAKSDKLTLVNSRKKVFEIIGDKKQVDTSKKETKNEVKETVKKEYSLMTVPALKAEMSGRTIEFEKTDTKPKLIKKLEAADALIK